MAVTAAWYGRALEGQWGATAERRVNFGADTIKFSLLQTGYTVDIDNHDFYNDISGQELATAGGYTAGGVTLAGKSVTYQTATNETQLDATDPSWTSASFSAYKAASYVDTAGAATADPLMGYIDFGGVQTVTSGTFTVQFDATGMLKIVS